MNPTATVLMAQDIYDVKPLMGDDDYSGCPCFHIDTPDVYAEGHCWRVGHDDHPYDSRKSDGRACVHVWSEDPRVPEKLRTLLDEAQWYGGWALAVEEARPTRPGGWDG